MWSARRPAREGRQQVESCFPCFRPGPRTASNRLAGWSGPPAGQPRAPAPNCTVVAARQPACSEKNRKHEDDGVRQSVQVFRDVWAGRANDSSRRSGLTRWYAHRVAGVFGLAGPKRAKGRPFAPRKLPPMVAVAIILRPAPHWGISPTCTHDSCNVQRFLLGLPVPGAACPTPKKDQLSEVTRSCWQSAKGGRAPRPSTLCTLSTAIRGGPTSGGRRASPSYLTIPTGNSRRRNLRTGAAPCCPRPGPKKPPQLGKHPIASR